MKNTDTKEKIMGAARAVVQAHGYNALSFRELAKEVGVKSASIHYHFPTKGDLGAALGRRYIEDATVYLEAVMADFPDQTTRFSKYAQMFRAALANDNRMCLCGIMAAEYGDLPPEVRAEVDGFTELNVRWLAAALASDKPAAAPEDLQRQAMAIFAAIEGAQLVARGRGDIGIFDRTIDAYRTAGLIP